MNVPSLILSPIVLFVSFYIPGSLFLQFIKVKLSKTEKFIVAWMVGIVIFYITTYSFAWINLDFIPLFLIAIASIFYLLINWRNRKNLKHQLSNLNKPISLAIIFGSLVFSAIMFSSGFMRDDGLQFMHVNAIDGIRHISYIKNMVFNFPPEQPGLAGEELRGFHYAFDFTLSRFYMFYGISPEDLYFRTFPFLMACLYGASFYLAGRALGLNDSKILWVLFFAYFSQSFSFLLIPFIEGTDLVLHSIVQPIGLIENRFTVLSIAFLITAVSLLTKLKDSWRYAVVIGLMLGIISQMKVYVGLIAITMIISYSFYSIIIKRRKVLNYAIAVAVTGLLTAVTYLPNNLGAGGLLFAPLLFYKHYMQQPFYDAVFQWELKRLVYVANGNFIRVALLYSQAIGLFLLVNLGLRMVILFRTRSILTKRFWENELFVVWGIMLLFPVFIVSFFVQSNAFQLETVQFFWILLVLLSIPSGIVIGDLLSGKSHVFKALIIFIVLAVTMPQLIRFGFDYFDFSRAKIIQRQDLELMKKVGSSIPEEEFLVYIPEGDSFQNSNLLISAMTGRSLYVEPGNIPNKEHEETYEKRTEQIGVLREAIVSCNKEEVKEILKKIGSGYIISKVEYECLSKTFNLADKSPNYYFYTIPLD